MKSGATPKPEHHRLTFHWPARPQISLPLVGFLFLSFLAHGLAFYLFQVVYPPVAAISPPPAQLNLLTPSTPENQAILRWIDAEDPAIIANPHEIVPGNLYNLAYQQSFAEIRSTPKMPGEKTAAIAFPPARGSMELINDAHIAVSTIPAKMLPRPTELKFSGQLSDRKILHRSPLKFDGQASRDPSGFMVGVGPDGKVLYTFFLGQETDDKAKAVRKQAEELLATMEFSRVRDDGVAWGVATFFWGNDPAPSPQP